MAKKGVIYVADDAFKISDEIENMSEEELDYRIMILEAEALETGRDIPEPELKRIQALIIMTQNTIGCIKVSSMILNFPAQQFVDKIQQNII